MEKEKTIAITLKGITQSERDDFRRYCAFYGTSMTKFLTQFLRNCNNMMKGTPADANGIDMTLAGLSMSNIKLLDKLISEIDKSYDDIEQQVIKDMTRFTFITNHKEEIFNKYMEYLDSQ